jgi:1,4-alpha-glucan branching enzyme
MGQEFLEWGAWTDAEELDWSKAGRFAGIRALYRDLVRLRRNWHGTTEGLKGNNVHVHHVNHADKLLAFHRWSHGGPRDDVVVVANMSQRAYPAYTLGLPRAGLWRVRLNSDWQGYSSAFGGHPSYDLWASGPGRDDMPVQGTVSLGPYTALVLSQDG